MNEYIIDPVSWFGAREVKFTPPHFIVSKTPLTSESKAWIYRTLKGRFSVAYPSQSGGDDFLNLLVVASAGCPAFEFPEEALAYELKWA